MERRDPGDPDPPVEARPAATIVLVRPGPDGIEVLLTRRPDTMAFAAGLHVFPGGRVDPLDGGSGLRARAAGPVDDPDFHVEARIAAIRETWEEVGVLLADGSGTMMEGGSSELAPGVRHPDAFAAVAADHDLRLRTDALVEVARWTTPRAYPRRFATRFFAAEVPTDVVLRPDPGEVAGHTWLTPRAALAEMAAGRIAMWPPTSTTLQRLERARSFDEVRDGLALHPAAPIGVRHVSPGLTVMTGQHAFGPGGRPANTILVGTDDVIVIDPGDPGETFIDAIEAEVAARGGRIVAIALTHVDPGHAAGSEELRARTGAPIVCGPGGAAALSWTAVEIDEGDSIGTLALSGRPAQGIERQAGSVDPMQIRVVRTPGHRPDHLSFILPDRTLVAGDAIVEGASLIRPPEGDPRRQRATIARLAAMVGRGEIRRVIPGHGRDLDIDAVFGPGPG